MGVASCYSSGQGLREVHTFSRRVNVKTISGARGGRGEGGGWVGSGFVEGRSCGIRISF